MGPNLCDPCFFIFLFYFIYLFSLSFCCVCIKHILVTRFFFALLKSTDISDIVKSVSRKEHCSYLYEFLYYGIYDSFNGREMVLNRVMV